MTATVGDSPSAVGVRRLVAASAVAAAVAFARRRYLRWGSTAAESRSSLPGDELVRKPNITATRAISIAGAAEAVWPWVAQIGQARGGFYSYDVLENLVGCEMRSAERIVPEWQSIAVGDTVRLHPEIGLRVSVLAQGATLVLHGGPPMGPDAPPYDFTWAFVVRDRGDGTTRLIVRERYEYTRWWSALLVEPVQVISFIMTQRMLRGIRQRAQRAASTAGAEAR